MTDSQRVQADRDHAAGRPLGQVIATVVLGLQGLALIGVAVWLLVEQQTQQDFNRNVVTGSMAYFFVLGPIIVLLAVGLWLGKGWCYGAAFFWQLIALAMAYEMARGGFWVGAVLLGLAALGTMGALVRTDTRAALGRL